MISYGKQSINKKDIDAIKKVLESDFLTQGPIVNKFENKLKSFFGAKYCSAVSNGTAALHLVSIALDWGRGDIVITSPITFLATANCIVYSGATPDFVDINSNSYNIDLNKLEDKLKSYKNKGEKVKAVIGVDYAGNPCDWKGLRFLANKFDFKLVNDNCHAMGARYKSDKGYATKYADLVTQSYHPVKNFTTGEGGSVMTNIKTLDDKIKLLRSHGMSKDSNILTRNEGPWYYEMHEIGYNYRLTDFQCALGLSQLEKLGEFIKKRQIIAKVYNSAFETLNCLKIPQKESLSKHAFHLYPILIDFNGLGKSRKSFFDFMMERNINLQVHYIPIYRQPFYKDRYNFQPKNFPESENFYSKEVSLPIYPDLTKSQQEKVISSIFDFINAKK